MELTSQNLSRNLEQSRDILETKDIFLKDQKFENVSYPNTKICIKNTNCERVKLISKCITSTKSAKVKKELLQAASKQKAVENCLNPVLSNALCKSKYDQM